jgi:hypothetical protein
MHNMKTRGQVALFVMIGFVVLVAVVIGMVMVTQQRTAVDAMTEPETSAEESSIVIEERAMMQQRLDDCLAGLVEEQLTTVGAEEVLSPNIAELEVQIEQHLVEVFPSCFEAFNTRGLTANTGVPEVDVTLGEERLIVDITYPATGTVEGESYRLEAFAAVVETGLGRLAFRADAVFERLSGNLNEMGLKFINEQCDVDLYAFADEGVYADLVTKPDGSMIAYFYDYTKEVENTVPMLAVELPACQGGATS